MNPAYKKQRLTQLNRKIKQMEEELRDLKRLRTKLKEEITKPVKKT